MYEHLLMTHSWLRYIVVILMIWAIVKAYQSSKNGLAFDKGGNRLRLWTVLTSHLQLILGFVLYMKSPLVKTFMKTFKDGTSPVDATFFGLYHFIGMTIAVIILTIGSAKAKRKTTDSEKWKTMFVWFLIAFIIIFITIPWPFSPFTETPWIRTP